MVRGSIAALVVIIAAIVPMTTLVSLTLAADPPKAAELETEVRKLLADLDAPTRAARGAAAGRLLELGPVVLPYLPPPELLKTVSIRETVERIRHDLERRQAIESTKASRVELGGMRPLKAWLAEISARTGNSLDVSRLPEPLLDRNFTVDNRPSEFWPLLDELASGAGLDFAASPLRRGLILKESPEKGALQPVVRGYSGPFRLTALAGEVVSLGESRDASFRRSLVRFGFAVQPEPRLRPLFLQYAMSEIRASSVKAGRLRPFSPEASYELAAGEPAGSSTLQLDYVLPHNEAIDAIDLTGSLRMTVAAGSAAVRFDDIMQHAGSKSIEIERRRGGATVVLQRVRRENDANGKLELRVRIAIVFDKGGPAFESHRTWMLHNEVYLESKGSQRLSVNGGFETTLEGDGAVGVEYRFVDLPDSSAAYTFVYVVPTLIIDVPVDFTLKSIPVRAATVPR